MLPVRPTHWIHEQCAWGNRIRRVKVTEVTDNLIYFINAQGFTQHRHKHHIVRVEPFDWQPLNSEDVYQQAIICYNCFSERSLASEVQELRLRAEYLREKLKLVTYDHWALRTDGVIEELLSDSEAWYPTKETLTVD